MLGFSYYLDHDLNQDDKNYIHSMQQHHFNKIFTSLHIPEDDQTAYAQRLRIFLNYTAELNLNVFIDIDQKTLANLPADLPAFKLRLDDGFTNQTIAQMSQKNPLALNASTLNEQDILELKKYQANFDNIEAWHNFYPRPETGLDSQWFKEKNLWFKQLGITTQAFIPGDQTLRGPIYTGLPTLESQRHQNLLASAIQLQNDQVDKIFIGDPRLSLNMQEKFDDYFDKDILDLNIKKSSDFPDYLLKKVLHNRPDPAADVIRVVESRGMNALNKDIVLPTQSIPRNAGSITIDNQNYGRYMGEVQLTKKDLPLDEKVNVLGHLDQASIQLLPFISANSAFTINKKE